MVRKHVANLFKMSDTERNERKKLKKSNKIIKTNRKLQSLLRNKAISIARIKT